MLKTSGQLERHFAETRHVFVFLDFDATLGFPGEGPPIQNMTCTSSNIGSLQTNPMWKTWEADIICLQETRIGRNNIKHAKKTFECDTMPE